MIPKERLVGFRVAAGLSPYLEVPSCAPRSGGYTMLSSGSLKLSKSPSKSGG